MRQGTLWVWAAASAVLLTLSGCASKGWVREFVGGKEVQIDQRVGQVETRVAQEAQRINAVDGRVGEVATQVGKVEGQVADQAQRIEGMGFRVTKVEQSVGEAGDTARSALAKAEGVDARLTRLWSNRHKRTVVDSVSIPFAFDRFELSDNAQTALLVIARELQANPTLSVQLEGHTDSKGSRDYNYSLSERRVEAVRRFLARQGVELERIYSVGLGPVDDRGVRDRDKRRVTVKLLTDSD
jgi:outer membrane protein OmpA-like peptidoglycan-associated protein